MRKKRLLSILVTLVLLLTAFVPSAYASGNLEVTSSVTPQALESAGNIEIALTLSNVGEIELEDITLVAENGSETPLGSIEPGASRSFQVSNYFVEEERIGGAITLSFVWFEEGNWEQLEHEIAIVQKVAKPELKLSRSAEPTSGKKGDTIKLEYVVENTGDVRINDISIEDPIIGETIASGVDLRPGRKQTYRSEIKLENSVESRPTASGTSEDGDDVSADVAPLKIEMRDPRLTVAVAQGMSQTNADAAETGTTFDIHVTNEGNVELTAITLQDDLDTIIEDGLKLAPGEDVHYTYVQSTLEDREIVITATCDAEGEDERLEFKSEGVALAPSYRPEDIVLRAEAALDTTTLDGPGEISVQLHLTNESPVPIFHIEISESGAGLLQEIDRLNAGATQTVESKMQIVQSGQLTFTVNFTDVDDRPYSISLEPIGISMPEPTPEHTATVEQTPVPAASQTRNSNPAWMLAVMAVLALLLLVALIALLVTVARHARLKRRAREDSDLVVDASPGMRTKPDAAPTAPRNADNHPREGAPWRTPARPPRNGEPVRRPRATNSAPGAPKQPPTTAIPDRKKPAARHIPSPFAPTDGAKATPRKPTTEAAQPSNNIPPVARPEVRKTPPASPPPATQTAPTTPKPSPVGGGKPTRKPIQKDIAGVPETPKPQDAAPAKPAPKPAAQPKPAAMDEDDLFLQAFLDGDE